MVIFGAIVERLIDLYFWNICSDVTYVYRKDLISGAALSSSECDLIKLKRGFNY